ncbi:MAG: hypothetical protein WC785_05880 [Tatlockia sp.]|jgi:hypothetical protein
MEKSRIEVMPHPHLLEVLFAYKSKVSSVFHDVLGIHETSHIAITKVQPNHKILILSSTPAMEFNLFNSNLWRFDKTYQNNWFTQCTQASWQSLYSRQRYDELYYLRQIKHHYSIGYSYAAQLDGNFYIYSLASQSSHHKTHESFANQYDDFYKIGQYCTNLLNPIFHQADLLSADSNQG